MPTARRTLLAGLAGLPLVAIPRHGGATTVARIGYQAYGTLVLLKASGRLEAALAPEGMAVEWKRFPAGPQMLEALGVGAIDFAATGEVPPIIAQAAGASIVYVGAEPPAPEGEAIVVPRRSTVFSVAELRGKRVVLNKGSNVHWLLVRALAEASLDFRRVEPAFMAPTDARAAFQSGQIDAWAIWDPYYAAAEADLGARTLRDGVGLVPNRQIYLATKDLAAEQPKLIELILAALRDLDGWLATRPGEAVPLLGTETGLDETIAGRAVSRMSFGVQTMTPSILADQQAIADAFGHLNLIAGPVRVSEAAWTPPA